MKRTRTCLLIAIALLGGFAVDSDRHVSPMFDDALATATGNPLQAARLRKLHLVRPDLINYPLAFETVC